MIVEQLAVSLIACAAYGIMFNVPRRTFVQSGLVGMLGWLAYTLLMLVSGNAVLATLVAAVLVTVVSQIFAKLYRTPIIVFSVAGIIPLVPGGIAYDAMRNVVENRYDAAVQLGAKAFMISGAIAIGLVLSEIINQAIRKSNL